MDDHEPGDHEPVENNGPACRCFVPGICGYLAASLVLLKGHGGLLSCLVMAGSLVMLACSAVVAAMQLHDESPMSSTRVLWHVAMIVVSVGVIVVHWWYFGTFFVLPTV